MGSPVNVPVPKTWTDLSLDQLKIMYSGRKSLSSRRLACVVDKYDLLKYLWKEAIIEDRTLEQYKVNNIDEISRHDDAFSRHLLGDDIFSGENEYAKQRLNDTIQQTPEETTCHRDFLLKQFAEKKFQIRELVRADIGTKWREFGRRLKIKEGKLDSINKAQNEIECKVDEIFKAFEHQCRDQCLDEFMYVERICTALVDTRRKDLSREVIKIMGRKLI